MGMLSERLFLLRLAPHKAVMLEQLTGNASADRHAGCRNALGNFAWAQVGPAYAMLWVARRVFGNHVQKGLAQLRPLLDQPPAATPFFRMPPPAGSSGSSKSAKPWRMV